MIRTLVAFAVVVASTRGVRAQPGGDAPVPDPASAPMPPAEAVAPVAPPSIVVPPDPAVALHEANAAATAGDWARVNVYVQALLARPLQRADLGEAHRLAGIAAMFEQPPNRPLAEQHFLEYLRIDLDGNLDPALYPPEVVTFFSDVRARHAAELRARRPKPKRYAILNLVPPWGQYQNGEHTKAIVIGSLLGTFVVANVTTYLVLRSWCTEISGPGGTSAACDEGTNRTDAAQTLRSINITAGVGLILTYLYGVYDGVRGYRRLRREPTLVPYASSTNTSTTVGVRWQF